VATSRHLPSGDRPRSFRTRQIDCCDLLRDALGRDAFPERTAEAGGRTAVDDRIDAETLVPYDFHEAAGDVVHDTSGHGLDARMLGGK
jgi:hypothetical protein